MSWPNQLRDQIILHVHTRRNFLVFVAKWLFGALLIGNLDLVWSGQHKQIRVILLMPSEHQTFRSCRPITTFAIFNLISFNWRSNLKNLVLSNGSVKLSKCDPNGIKIAIFYKKNHKKSSCCWWLCPQDPHL